jgi:hypothetical protein
MSGGKKLCRFTKSDYDRAEFFRRPDRDDPAVKIVSFSSPPMRSEFVGIVKKSQESYAKQHGYSYAYYEEPFDTSRAPPWSKIVALFRQLRQSSEDWLLWIDDDAIITNPSIRLGTLIHAYGRGKNIVIAEDAHADRGIPINTGLFLIRNDAWSELFLRHVWHAGLELGLRNLGTLHEQQAMTHVVFHGCREHIRQYVSVVSKRLMNSFIRYSAYDDPEDSRWRPGDLAAHMTGIQNRDRDSIARQLASNPNRIPEMRGGGIRKSTGADRTPQTNAPPENFLTWTALCRAERPVAFFSNGIGDALLTLPAPRVCPIRDVFHKSLG